MGRKTEKSAIPAGGTPMARKRAKRRLTTEKERALEIGFLELAKDVAQENAETLRLLAKN